MANNCDRCAEMEQQIKRLKEQNRRLQERIRRAILVAFYWLRRCQLVQEKAQQVLSQPSGVERGRWSYTRGIDATIKLCICALSQVLAALQE